MLLKCIELLVINEIKHTKFYIVNTMKQFEEKYINIKSTLTCRLLLYLHSDKLRHFKRPLRILGDFTKSDPHFCYLLS